MYYWHLLGRSRNAAKHFGVNRMFPRANRYPAQMSLMLRFRTLLWAGVGVEVEWGGGSTLKQICLEKES